jgi:hypothetical protein
MLTSARYQDAVRFTNRAWFLPWLWLACLVLAGCSAIEALWGKHLNPDYCRDHLDDSDCRRAFPDAAPETTCTSNAVCKAPTGVCDTRGSMMCVQCVAPDQVSACGGTTPACGADHVCRACARHDDCPLSRACLPDGSCAGEADVAYVDSLGISNASCTKLSPCNQVMNALGTSRPYVKLRGTIDEAVLINDRSVTFLAEPGATLTRASTGVILKVDGTSVVRIYDLSIADGLGAGGIGISLPPGNSASLELRRVTLTNNAGGGISTVGGSLTVSQSTISGNTGGGISISKAQFDVTNSFIVNNGGPLSVIGGVDITQISDAGTHRLDFNTITGNVGTMTVNAGVNCSTITVPLTFDSNIIFGNTVTGGGKQVGGDMMCTASYSDVGPDPAPGTGNINADPLFVDRAHGDFHLMTSSPAKGAADPGASLGDDYDGDVRPQPTGGRRDMGADEVTP